MLRLRQMVLDLAVPHTAVLLSSGTAGLVTPARLGSKRGKRHVISNVTRRRFPTWNYFHPKPSGIHLELYSKSSRHRYPPSARSNHRTVVNLPRGAVLLDPTQSARWFMSRTCTVSEYLVICGPYATKTKDSPIKSRGALDSLILPEFSVE